MKRQFKVIIINGEKWIVNSNGLGSNQHNSYGYNSWNGMPTNRALFSSSSNLRNELPINNSNPLNNSSINDPNIQDNDNVSVENNDLNINTQDPSNLINNGSQSNKGVHASAPSSISLSNNINNNNSNSMANNNLEELKNIKSSFMVHQLALLDKLNENLRNLNENKSLKAVNTDKNQMKVVLQHKIRVITEEIKVYNEIANLIRANFVGINNNDVDKINQVLLESKIFHYLKGKNIDTNNFIVDVLNLYILINWFGDIVPKSVNKEIHAKIRLILGELLGVANNNGVINIVNIIDNKLSEIKVAREYTNIEAVENFKYMLADIALEHRKQYDLTNTHFNWQLVEDVANYVYSKGNKELEKIFLNSLDSIVASFKSYIKDQPQTRKTSAKGIVTYKDISLKGIKTQLKGIIDLNLNAIKDNILRVFEAENQLFYSRLKSEVDMFKEIIRKDEELILKQLTENGILLRGKNIELFNNIKNNLKSSYFSSERDIKFNTNILDEFKNLEAVERNLMFGLDNSGLFKIIRSIIESDNSDVNKQLLLEKGLLDYEINYFNNIFINSEINIELKLLHKYHDKMKIKLRAYIKAYTSGGGKKLQSKINTDTGQVILALITIGEDKVLSFAFKQLISIINVQNKMHSADKLGIGETQIITELGKRVIRYAYFTAAKDSDINSGKNYKGELIPELRDSAGVRIGLDLLKIMLEMDDFLERVIFKTPTNSEVVIKVKNEWFNKLVVSSLNISQLPMLTPPRPVNEDGVYSPYLLPEIYNLYNPMGTPIKIKFDQRELSKTSDVVNNCLNGLNSVAFKINKDVLYYVLNEWNDPNSLFFNGQNQLLEILPEDKGVELKRKLSHNSKVQLNVNILKIALLYKDVNFYLPMFLDFRGRMYVTSSYLSYQGSDLARALLLFSDGEKLTEAGLDCLLAYAGNLAGFDKLSLHDKIRSMMNKLDEFSTKYMTEVAMEVAKSKEPFQYLAMMLLFSKLMEEKPGMLNVVVHNPILFDATCSGLQHLSGLTKEMSLAKLTNVLTTSEKPFRDKPQDFYLFALSRVQFVLDNSDIPAIRKLVLDRKIIKRPVMTIPYNISITGVGGQLLEHFEVMWVNNKESKIIIPGKYSKDGQPFELSWKEFGELSKLVFNTLQLELPSLKKLNLYLVELISIVTSFNLPVNWITPAGMKVSLSTVKMKSTRVSSSLINDGRSKITLSLPTKELNIKKIKTSFMPDLIHSLDASNIHLLVNDLVTDLPKNKIPIYTIHDCFATLPNRMFELEDRIKSAFIKMYFDKSYLEELHDTIIASLIKVKGVEIIDKHIFKDNIDTGLVIPNIPDEFLIKDNDHLFESGLRASRYFIC